MYTSHCTLCAHCTAPNSSSNNELFFAQQSASKKQCHLIIKAHSELSSHWLHWMSFFNDIKYYNNSSPFCITKYLIAKRGDTIFQYFIVQIPVRLANKRVSQALMEDIQNKNRFWQVKRSKRLRTDFWWAWPQAAPRKGLQWLIRVNIASLPVLAITSSDNPPTTPIWPGSQFLQSWDQPLIWRITPPGQLISQWVLWSEEVWS